MIPEGFQPILSGVAPKDLSKIKYPVLVSPKLDGIRCVVFGGVGYSRKLKPIPNAYIQRYLSEVPDGFDGELIVGENTGEDVMNRTASGVMSQDGEPNFRFHVFDWCIPEVWDTPFKDRLAALNKVVPAYSRCSRVPQHVVSNDADLLAIERMYLTQGYEGVMIREPSAPYKLGRSTTKEGILLKLKRFIDAEAYVVGFVERQHNTNEQERDERGYAKRSKAKDGMVGTATLGALVCHAALTPDGSGLTTDGDCNIEFEIGTGMDDATRMSIWNQRADVRGKLVKFKYQGLTPKNKPRFPSYLGFRSEIDL